MKVSKKVISMLIVYAFILTVLPINILSKSVKAVEGTVPKYLTYNEGYIMSGMQYKDKSLLYGNFAKDFGAKYFSNGKTSIISNLDWFSAISDKQVVDVYSGITFDLESGKTGSLENDSAYVKEKNAVTAKYGLNSMASKKITPIRSLGGVKWCAYKISYLKDNVQYYAVGFVNSNSKVIELEKGTNYIVNYKYSQAVYGSNVYNNNIYWINSDKNVLFVATPSGTSMSFPLSNGLKSMAASSRIYSNKNGIYLGYNKFTYDTVTKKDSFGYILQKVAISNGQAVASGSPIINCTLKAPFNCISLDISNNMWTVKDGYVYKIENDKLVKKYQVSSNMNGVYVYDDYHLAVSGYDYTSQKGIYTTINVLNGWLASNGKRYYYQGGKKLTGWAQISGKKYYLDSTGAMKTGWIQVSGKKYYLDSTGAMKTGWVAISNKWYYFYSNGQMAINTTIQGHKIGSNGVRIN